MSFSFVDEDCLEKGDVRLRRLVAFCFSFDVWVKISWFEHLRFLRVAIDIGNERHQGRRVVPVVLAFGLGHPDQFPQRQPSGVDADDSGEFPKEAIAVCATDSGSSSSIVVSA